MNRSEVCFQPTAPCVVEVVERTKVGLEGRMNGDQRLNRELYELIEDVAYGEKVRLDQMGCRDCPMFATSVIKRDVLEATPPGVRLGFPEIPLVEIKNVA